RKPLIMNSLAMMTITTQAGSCPEGIRQIMAEHTRSLSARGSMNFPKFVTRFLALAIFPSSMSVRLAAQKITRAIHLLASPAKSVSMKNTKNGTMITRSTVSLFGKFILHQLSYQIVFCCPCDFHPGKIAGHQFLICIYKDQPIHVRGVLVGPAHVDVLVGHFSLDHDQHLPADHVFCQVKGNLLLELHQLCLPVFFHFLRDLALHPGRRCPLLRRVGKDA